MADTSNSLGRRKIAGAALLGSLAALAGGSVPPPSVDAELIAMGVEAARLRREHAALMPEWWSMHRDHPRLDGLASELNLRSERLWELSDRALLLPASTPDGMRGKAEIARHFLHVECEGQDGKMVFNSADQELMWSLICDMTDGVS